MRHRCDPFEERSPIWVLITRIVRTPDTGERYDSRPFVDWHSFAHSIGPLLGAGGVISFPGHEELRVSHYSMYSVKGSLRDTVLFRFSIQTCSHKPWKNSLRHLTSILPFKLLLVGRPGSGKQLETVRLLMSTSCLASIIYNLSVDFPDPTSLFTELLLAMSVSYAGIAIFEQAVRNRITVQNIILAFTLVFITSMVVSYRRGLTVSLSWCSLHYLSMPC